MNTWGSVTVSVLLQVDFQDVVECRCGNQFGRLGIRENCNLVCLSDRLQLCGGSGANLVHRIDGKIYRTTHYHPGSIDGKIYRTTYYHPGSIDGKIYRTTHYHPGSIDGKIYRTTYYHPGSISVTTSCQRYPVPTYTQLLP